MSERLGDVFQEMPGGASAASPTRSQLQALPRGLSSSGADEWGSAALGAPPRRVSRTPLKILQNIVCACVCASVTGPCQKGAFLECLLTFSLVFITHQSRMFIHRAAFCSRDAAMSSAGMDGNSRWLLRMSLPGATSREHRPWSSTLKAWELPEKCQELVAEPRAWAPPCQSLTDGCGLSFPAASSPGPPPSYGAQSWTGWWDFAETAGVLQCPCRPLGWGTEPPQWSPVVGHRGGMWTVQWVPGTLCPPSSDSATSVSLGSAGALGTAYASVLRHVKMWLQNKLFSAVRVQPLYSRASASELSYPGLWRAAGIF